MGYKKPDLHTTNVLINTAICEANSRFNDGFTQFEIKKELLFQEWEQFKAELIDNSKTICHPDLLKNFSEPSVNQVCDKISIGERCIEVNFGNQIKNISYPELISFNDSQNLVVVYDSEHLSKAEAISDVLIIRVLFSNLPDKLKIHLYDNNMHEKFQFIR